VRADVAREEDGPVNRGLRDRAVVHIDATIGATRGAIGGVEQAADDKAAEPCGGRPPRRPLASDPVMHPRNTAGMHPHRARFHAT
jgi:hypothetical protein